MRLAIILVVLLAVPHRSDACKAEPLSVFELFERAATVAHVRVVSVPQPRPGSRNPIGAGSVQLSVKRMLKGAKRSSLRTVENNTSCHIGFRRGRSALVFLDAQGHTLGQQAYMETFAPFEASLDGWAAATSDVTRRTILVDAIAAQKDPLARHAAMFLANDPSLLVKLDADQRQRVAIAPLVAERLTGGKLEGESDVAKLAAIIEAGASDPDRIAALERCERVHARRLWPFTQYRDGVAIQFWKTLANACRTGTPVTF
jgi:hypothetical protein